MTADTSPATKYSFTDARLDWVKQAADKGLPMPSRDELAAFADGFRAAEALSATATKHAVTQEMYEAGMKYLHGKGTAWCCTDLYLAMEAARV